MENCERCRKILYSKLDMIFFSPTFLIGERESGWWWSVEDAKGKMKKTDKKVYKRDREAGGLLRMGKGR